MPSGLNTQTEREVRYEQRCIRQKIDLQSKDRELRFKKRNEITFEVDKEIEQLKKKRTSVNVSRYVSYH